MSPTNDPDAPKPVPPRPARPCPICGRKASPEFQPFCSKRCADVDLNRWLTGRYAIPGREGEAGDVSDED